MKYTVVIPTYVGHSVQIERCLSSFERFLKDADRVSFYLIVSRPDIARFTELTDRFKGKLDIQVVTLQAILKDEENIDVDENLLLKQVGKFNYQSLKKIYAVKHFGEDMSLVLDSEALMIRPASLSEIFETYRRNKFIIHATPNDDPAKQGVTRLSFELLGKAHENLWFFEYYYWFFEKKYVDELFAYILTTTGKSLYEHLLHRKPMFEYNLYALFLYFFHKESYRVVDASKLLGKYLTGDELIAYTKMLGGTTSFEYLCWGITPGNSKSLSRLFHDMHMAFFHYDDRHGDVAAQVAFVQRNKDIVLLTSHVVTQAFSIDGLAVPANFEKAVPTSPLRNWLRKLKNWVNTFARKVRIRSKELLSDTWYALVLKIRLDRAGMVLRYAPAHADLKVDPDLVFDVGAYTGTSLPRFRSLGYAKVVCFEPSHRSFVRLYRKHHNDSGVSFVNRAVSDTSDATITLYENPDVPTLNTATDTWFTIPRHKGLVRSFKERQVKTITLDNAIEIIGAIPGYIKIDVEGHELSVLRGLHHKPSMLSFEWISERKERNIEVLQHVRDLGFTKFYLLREEALPDFAPGTELSAEEVIAEWNAIRATGETSPWGNVWCT